MNPPTTPLFDSLSLADQRRAIAADVIAQIKANRFKPVTGVFVGFQPGSEVDLEVRSPDVTTIRELLAIQKPKVCRVCALGSLLMSQVNLNGDCLLEDVVCDVEPNSVIRRNLSFYTDPFDRESYAPINLRPFDNSDREALSPYILKYFSTEQLQTIEIAYERGDGAFQCRSAVVRWREDDEMDEFAEAVEEYNIKITIEQAHAAIVFGKRFVDNDKRLLAIMQAIIDSPTAEFNPAAIAAT